MELLLLKTAVALAPVLVMLAVFVWLDAFKLVSQRALILLVIGGGLIAALSYPINGRFIDTLPIGFTNFSRFIAPPIEETLKAALILFLFARNRIGFMIDAAIAGIAVGAGFSMVENLIYIVDPRFAHATLGVWIVRGFGTAIMHAGATALFAVMGQFLTERYLKLESQHHRLEPLMFLPGLALAILAHGAFNQFPDQPTLAMALTLLSAPMLLFLVFSRSEHAAHKWLLTDYENHQHMLDEIAAGKLPASEAGRFVTALAEQFQPGVAADMFRYIQVHTWLVAKAEADLLAREQGEAIDLGEVRERLAELHDLERRIGRTALMALNPHLHFTRNDLWEMHELETHARQRRRA